MKLYLTSLCISAALFFAGCGDVYGDLCDRGAHCRGRGSEADLAACVEELSYKEEVAHVYGCEDLFDSYIICMEGHAVCDGDKLSGCDDQKDRYKDCVDDRETADIKVDLRRE